MKLKKILSLLVCVSMLFAFGAAAAAEDRFAPGDVNGDGKVAAEDARLCLRQAVGLETFEKGGSAWLACEVTGDGEVTAADARIILRAAVGLETLCAHEFSEWTPEKDENGELTGKHTRMCAKCLAVETADCEYGEKTYLTENEAPTCTEACAYTETCAVCGGVRETTEAALGHTLAQEDISVDQDAVCERCGETVPSFNTMVNALKKSEHTYTGFTESKNTAEVLSHKFRISLAAKAAAKLAGETIDENTIVQQFKEEMAGNAHSYSDYAYQRPITNGNFYLAGQDIVSALTADNVKAIRAETVEGVDFIASLPDSVQIQSMYSSASFNLDLTDSVKAAEIGKVLKVTVELKDEKYSQIKDSTETTALQNAADLDLRAMVAELNQKEEQDGLLFEMKCTDATTKCTVTYYFDAELLLPLAATYDLTVDSAETVTMDMKLGGISMMSGNMSFSMQNRSVNYYFFDHYFD